MGFCGRAGLFLASSHRASSVSLLHGAFLPVSLKSLQLSGCAGKSQGNGSWPWVALLQSSSVCSSLCCQGPVPSPYCGLSVATLWSLGDLLLFLAFRLRHRPTSLSPPVTERRAA